MLDLECPKIKLGRTCLLQVPYQVEDAQVPRTRSCKVYNLVELTREIMIGHMDFRPTTKSPIRANSINPSMPKHTASIREMLRNHMGVLPACEGMIGVGQAAHGELRPSTHHWRRGQLELIH
jgi:hypothetical protein